MAGFLKHILTQAPGNPWEHKGINIDTHDFFHSQPAGRKSLTEGIDFRSGKHTVHLFFQDIFLKQASIIRSRP